MCSNKTIVIQNDKDMGRGKQKINLRAKGNPRKGLKEMQDGSDSLLIPNCLLYRLELHDSKVGILRAVFNKMTTTIVSPFKLEGIMLG